jgi:hypothetical protein
MRSWKHAVVVALVCWSGSVFAADSGGALVDLNKMTLRGLISTMDNMGVVLGTCALKATNAEKGACLTLATDELRPKIRKVISDAKATLQMLEEEYPYGGSGAVVPLKR